MARGTGPTTGETRAKLMLSLPNAMTLGNPYGADVQQVHRLPGGLIWLVTSVEWLDPEDGDDGIVYGCTMRGRVVEYGTVWASELTRWSTGWRRIDPPVPMAEAQRLEWRTHDE